MPYFLIFLYCLCAIHADDAGIEWFFEYEFDFLVPLRDSCYAILSETLHLNQYIGNYINDTISTIVGNKTSPSANAFLSDYPSDNVNPSYKANPSDTPIDSDKNNTSTIEKKKYPFNTITLLTIFAFVNLTGAIVLLFSLPPNG